MYEVRNKVFVITGGASGMGRSFVAHILGMGGIVSFGDINTNLANSLVLQIHSTAPRLVSRLLFTKTDIRDSNQIEDLLRRTKEVFGRIDVLLCVAGVNVPDSFLPTGDTPRPSSANLLNIEVNLSGTINTVYAALPYLCDDARIVVIASTAGLYPSSVQPLYSASKHGLIGFSRSLAPLLSNGKRIFVLAPSTYLPPSHTLRVDGRRVTPEVTDQDVFTKSIGETLGFVEMPEILKVLDQALQEAENGAVIEITPLGVGKAQLAPVPDEFKAMENKLRQHLCPGAKPLMEYPIKHEDMTS